ncbi:MAG TPA: hypothetical protein VG367_11795 [Mucilaginibacter sp.]|jgi:hypothetical protein|nr:hypothetical protein [Mucilaginibacter sp.]
MFSSPKICLVNVSSDVADAVSSYFSNVYIGDVGKIINTDIKQAHQIRKIRLVYDLPDNLHEYDIVIYDMNNHETINYIEDDHQFGLGKSKVANGIILRFPQSVFDGRPILSQQILAPFIRNEKRKIYIIFSSESESIPYEIGDFTTNNIRSLDTKTVNNYDFLNDGVSKTNKSGKELKVLDTEFKKVLNKHAKDARYEVTFKYNDQRFPNYLPLMTNKYDEVISYLIPHNDSYIFLLPNFGDKKDFLNEFLNETLPSFLPDFFPENTEAHWINSDDFTLPGVSELQNKKEVIVEEAEKRIVEIDEEIHKKMLEFQFLHDLIRETSDKLVSAVQKFLQYIGLESVIDVDNHSGTVLKEEDLRIEYKGKLLVTEVKGINGTSTDDDCSQISKVRYRKMRELNRTDVNALYIVNHQRYLPPPARDNPPFKDIQITDAVNDDRGLLTTWELYKAYGYIQKGILTKIDIEDQIFQTGLIRFLPKATHKVLGPPDEIHKNGFVFILNIADDTLVVGQNILVQTDDELIIARINGIKLNGNDVEAAHNGEYGFLIDKKIKKENIIWILRTAN